MQIIILKTRQILLSPECEQMPVWALCFPLGELWPSTCRFRVPLWEPDFAAEENRFACEAGLGTPDSVEAFHRLKNRQKHSEFFFQKIFQVIDSYFQIRFNVTDSCFNKWKKIRFNEIDLCSHRGNTLRFNYNVRIK